VREYWNAVDPALNAEPRQRILITKVESVEVRFLDPASRDWRTEWPTPLPSGQVNPIQIDMMLLKRPMAIEFTMVLEDWGRIQRVFEVPS
jgi:general secretion pathway protein J